ncbi:MAG TPA: PKD domain-containing protein, partial [Nitrosopumilaceae archaeon]|nr:PKD domain-containing protein [Nitrosopumilaceae archaeon]
VTANPTSGPPPLTVNFDGSKSSDPDAGTVLIYSWNFGDGSPTATGAIVTHMYNSAGPYVARLTVNDNNGGTNSATVNITVGNPPVGTINTPVAGTTYSAGNTILFSGSGTDQQDGVLPASAFHWVILFHHNTHTHPFLEFNGVKSGSFVIPTVGETSSDVWYRLYLTVTDSTGLTNLSTRDVLPNKSTITLTSNVSGLQVNLDGQPHTTSYSFVGVVGMTRTLQAPSPQNLGGQTYQFQSWSDGGGATHTISTPPSNTVYTENFVLTPTTTTSTLTVNSQDMNGNPITGYWTTLKQGTTTIASGFTPVKFTLNNGASYSIGVANYGNYYFDHWLDNGSTVQPRSISISVNTELTAVYRNSAASIISLSPLSGPAGNSVTVTGTNFLPSTAITIRYDGSIMPTNPSTITSNSNGGFSASFIVPPSVSGGHSVSATDGTRTGTGTFTVTSTGGTYPIVHMQDTTVSFATILSSSRPIVGEYVTTASQLVGDKIDRITLQMSKNNSPIGNAQIGVFNSDLTVKKLFGTIDASTISTSFTNYQFQLSSVDSLYTIQSGDIIGIKFTGSSSQGGINLTVDRNSADPFDGPNSFRVRYESSWMNTTGDDMYMILEQTRG